MLDKFIQRFRDFFFRRRIGACGIDVHIGKDVTIQHPECVHIGNHVGIAKHCYFLPCTSSAEKTYSPKNQNWK